MWLKAVRRRPFAQHNQRLPDNKQESLGERGHQLHGRPGLSQWVNGSFSTHPAHDYRVGSRAWRCDLWTSGTAAAVTKGSSGSRVALPLSGTRLFALFCSSDSSRVSSSTKTTSAALTIKLLLNYLAEPRSASHICSSVDFAILKCWHDNSRSVLLFHLGTLQ